MAEEAIQEQNTDPGEQTAEEPTAQPTAEELAANEAADKAEQEQIEQKPWYRKRFDELTRKRYEAQALADENKRRADELEERLRALETKKEPAKQQSGQRPTLEQFDYDQDAYFEALTDWKMEHREAERAKMRELQKSQEEERLRAQTFEQKKVSMIGRGKTKYDDWENVVLSMPPTVMNVPLAQALVELPDGDQIAYYLGKNLQEADGISKLSPIAMAAELGKLSVKLSSQEKKQSSSPPPINPLGGKTDQPTIPDPSKDPAGWIKARNEGRI